MSCSRILCRLTASEFSGRYPGERPGTVRWNEGLGDVLACTKESALDPEKGSAKASWLGSDVGRPTPLEV